MKPDYTDLYVSKILVKEKEKLQDVAEEEGLHVWQLVSKMIKRLRYRKLGDG